MRETENNKRYKAAMQGVGMQNVKMQQEAADKGSLQVNVTSSVNSYPISEARISISYTGVPENTLEQLVTDSSGLSWMRRRKSGVWTLKTNGSLIRNIH